jgi:hypothetical protein
LTTALFGLMPCCRRTANHLSAPLKSVRFGPISPTMKLLQGLQIESDARGLVSIMSPTGWSSGPINARVNRQLDAWAAIDSATACGLAC